MAPSGVSPERRQTLKLCCLLTPFRFLYYHTGVVQECWRQARIRSKAVTLTSAGLTVFDASGDWLCRWQRQFSRLAIPSLRSSLSGHPDPVSALALQHYIAGFSAAHATSITTEVPLPRSQAYTGPFLAPTTQIFDKFCGELVQRYGLRGQVQAAFVEQLDIIRPEKNTHEACLLRLHYREPKSPNSKTKIVYARRLVLALGPGQPRWPTWARSEDGCQPLPGCFHAEDFFSYRTPPPLEWKSRAITVVGGGITAVQWALLAAENGTWWMKKTIWREVRGSCVLCTRSCITFVFFLRCQRDASRSKAAAMQRV